MNIYGFDHTVLCVSSVEATLEFYQRVLGLEAREERAGKWSLHFGSNKISVQDANILPSLADKKGPGSGKSCVLTDLPIEDVITQLRSHDVEVVEGLAEKAGAVGKLMSVYSRDPDANLVEVSCRIS
ncbi:VOC family protein [Pelagibius sp.]|uniref:VOC family protein n=1 Tax=Pelagibius sp. TaxID=1931238 RepID=UPI003BAF9379